MKVFFHKNFVKKYKKLGPSEKKRVKERRNLFFKDPYHPLLYNHALHGAYMGYRSISVTGDMRIIYKFLDKDSVLFADIGSHSELYS